MRKRKVQKVDTRTVKTKIQKNEDTKEQLLEQKILLGNYLYLHASIR